ncbi:hypothetical protein ABZ714_28095 [Streptomyces sp. NPDC006798]|uniref:hypothetical protein n=1 Tax=Streptomyces sp. NPDC006798 TaxID=3155462 RepID=UPI0033F674D3
MNLPGFTGATVLDGGYGVFPAQVSYGTCRDECREICRNQCAGKYNPASCQQRCQPACIDDCLRPPCQPDCHEERHCNADGATVAVTVCKECDGTTSYSSPSLVKPTCP